MTTIRTSTKQSQIGQPKVNFRENDINAFIESKGEDIIIEQSYTCPCALQSNEALVTCKNCLGSGYIFINPIKTKALATSINRNTKYKEWNSENMGTIQLTVKEDSAARLTYYDKITIPNSLTEYTENRELLTIDDRNFIFTTYPVKKIDAIFLYNGQEELLIRLTESQYTIGDDEHTIDINSSAITDESSGVVSIRYTHKAQYLIIDLPHDFRQSFKINAQGTNTSVSLPINAIARKVSSLDLGEINANGTELLDNTFKT